MGNFNKGRGVRNGGHRSFGGDYKSRGGYSRDRRDDEVRGDKQMFSAVCSNCGKDCQVPFKPTGNKPVYCSDCFEKMGGRNNRRSFDRTRRGRKNYSDDNYKAQFESLNEKLDKIVNLLQPKNINGTTSVSVEPAVEKTNIKTEA